MTFPHFCIIPFYSSWLYICSSYYDYTRNKELYSTKLRGHHIENLFWNVFVFHPLSLGSVLYLQPAPVMIYDVYIELLHIITQIGFGEIWFYTFHYLLHTKYLYRFHKTHHENNEVIGIFALYAHPIDAVGLNLGSMLLLHYFIGCSVFHLYFIGTLATVNTIISAHTGTHSGFHQAHHRRFTCNYGMNYFMDRIFGTGCGV
jgi:sterol desaturase/sphingolipid hydroxylase (fatty acid hydroxylase superfamily)